MSWKTVGPGRPTAKWDRGFDFSNPVDRSMGQVHQHEFWAGFDLEYRDSVGRVRARLDGLRPDEATFLRQKHKI
jgi:hypothetical protein